MKKLTTLTEGVRGGARKNSTVGYLAAWSDNQKMLSVDNFHGSGNDYKQREEPIIYIFDGDNCIFEGTYKQLIEKIL